MRSFKASSRACMLVISAWVPVCDICCLINLRAFGDPAVNSLSSFGHAQVRSSSFGRVARTALRFTWQPPSPVSALVLTDTDQIGYLLLRGCVRLNDLTIPDWYRQSIPKWYK